MGAQVRCSKQLDLQAIQQVSILHVNACRSLPVVARVQLLEGAAQVVEEEDEVGEQDGNLKGLDGQQGTPICAVILPAPAVVLCAGGFVQDVRAPPTCTI